jgi:hypothetical protein
LGVKRIPDLEGWKFPIEIQKQIKEALKFSKVDPITNVVSQSNGILRTLKTGFDLGVGFIQGMPLLFTDPYIWGTTMRDSMRAAVDPTFYMQFAKNHTGTIRKMITDGVSSFGSAEFMEGAGILGKIPGIGQVLVKPFERQFTAYLDMAKVHLFEAFEKGNMTPQQIHNLTAVVDNMMGTLNSAKLGVSSYQRSVEAAYLSFSPRYRRAGIALLVDTFRGGIRGDVARKAMTSYMAGGMLTYYAVAKAMGQEPRLDPSKGDFLSVKIGDTTVKLGGQYITMMRLIGNTIKTIQENPEKLMSIDPRDQPLLKYLRGQTAPFMGLTTDLITGTTYLGESVYNKDFLASLAKRQLTPFAIESLIDAFSDSGYGVVPLQFFGLNAWTDSLYTKLEIAKDNKAKQKGFDSWDLWESKDPKATKIAMRDPVIQKLSDEYNAEIMKLKDGDKYVTWRKDYESVMNERMDALWDNEQRYNLTHNYENYKQGIKDSGVNYAEKLKELESKYPEVYAQLNQPHVTGKDESTQAMAYYAYLDKFYGDKDLDSLEGQARFDRLEKIKKEFIDKWGMENYKYASDTVMASRDYPPIYKARRSDIDEIGLSGFWDVPDEIKDQFRKDNPKIDAYLYIWGYGNSVISNKAQEIAGQRIQILNLPKVVPQSYERINNDAKIQSLTDEITKLQSVKNETYSATTQRFWLEFLKYRNYFVNTTDNFGKRDSKEQEKLTKELKDKYNNYLMFADLVNQYAMSNSTEKGLLLILKNIELTRLYNERWGQP